MDENTPSLEITFNSSLKVFMPGESVSGTVKFEANTNFSIEILSVYLHGEHYFYRGEEEVIHVFTTACCPLDLKGAGEGNDQMPFSFALRPDAPSSIATPLGGIRYRVYASLFFKKSNVVQQSAVGKDEYFTVIVPKQIKNSSVGKKESMREGGLFTCCLGFISGDLELANTSLLCGHCAVINACIINATGAHVLMTSLSLVQRVEHIKDGKVLKHKVATKERGSIMPGKRQVWLAERFLIPPLPPSGSYIYFYVSYNFVLEIQKSVTKTIKVKIPVTIGNIPLDCESIPSTWNDPAVGVEFWCSSIEESVKDVGFRPLYVSHL